MGVFRFIKKLLFGGGAKAEFRTPNGPAPETPVTTLEQAPVAEKRMRSGKPVILYLITKSNFGGAQRYVYDLASHAPPEYEAVVMCGPPRDGGAQDGLLIHKLAQAGVHTVQVPELRRDVGFTDFVAAYHIYRAIKAEAPYILHLNSSKAGGLGALAGRLAGVPNIIFTAHGWAFHEKRDFLSRVLIWFASIATILLAHKVICVSAYDRNAFRGWFFQSKLVAIHNALAPMVYPDKDDARRDLVPHHELFEKDIWIGSIAELNKNKNISLGLKTVKTALDAGCNIFYAVVGDGENRLDLEDEMRELKIDRNVRFLGFVSDAGKFMKAFDVAFLPSSKEGLPYFVLEGMRAGVPLLASNVGGIPEVIHDGVNGLLCPPDDVEAFSAALIRLAKDQELRVAMSKPDDADKFDEMLRETFAQYR